MYVALRILQSLDASTVKKDTIYNIVHLKLYVAKQVCLDSQLTASENNNK